MRKSLEEIVLATAGLLTCLMAVSWAQVKNPEFKAPASKAATLSGAILANKLEAPWFTLKLGGAGNEVLYVYVTGATIILQNGRPVSRSALRLNARIEVTGYYTGLPAASATEFHATRIVILPEGTAGSVKSPPVYSGYHPPAYKAYHPPTAKSNPPAAATRQVLPTGQTALTGTIQAVRSGYLELSSPGRAPLWVRESGARIEQNGRLIGPNVLRAGESVQVQGRMVDAQLWAVQIAVLPPSKAPVQSFVPAHPADHAMTSPPRPPAPAPSYAFKPVHPPVSYKPSPTGQMQRPNPAYSRGSVAAGSGSAARGTLAFHPTAPIPHPTGFLRLAPMNSLDAVRSDYASLGGSLSGILQWESGAVKPYQPSSSPNQGLSSYGTAGKYQTAGFHSWSYNGSADLCPVVSMFVNAPSLGDELTQGKPLDGSAFNAAFFNNPGAGVSQAQAMTQCPQYLSMPIAQTVMSGFGAGGQWSAQQPTSLYGGIPVTSPAINLDIPVYFDPYADPNLGSTAGARIDANFPFQHAQFIADIESQDAKGNWQLLVTLGSTQPSLDLYCNIGGPGDYASVPASTANATSALETATGGSPQGLCTYLWQIPVTLSQAVTTLRVGIRMTAWTNLTENGTPDNYNAAGPNGNGSVEIADPNSGQPLSQVWGGPNSSFQSGGEGEAEFVFSPAFTIFLMPTGLASAPVLPYTILYMPPGDRSTASYAYSAGIAQSVSFATTDTSSTQVAAVKSGLFGTSGGFSYAGIPIFKAGANTGQALTQSSMSWSANGASQVLGASEMFSNLTPLSAQTETCWTSAGTLVKCTPPAGDNVTLADEPFWNDEILLLLEPNESVWDYAPAGSSPGGQGGGFGAGQLVSYVDAGQSNLSSKVTMATLFVGAYGADAVPKINPPSQGEGLCDTNGKGWQPMSQSGCSSLGYPTVYLTPAQCAALFNLDPFAAAMWQGATPDPSRAAFQSYVSTADVLAGGSGISYNTTKSSGAGTVGGFGNSECNGTTNLNNQNLQILAVTAAFSQSQSTTNCTGISYSQSVVTTQTTGITISGTMQDDGTSFGPSQNNQRITEYLDLWFGGIMFQDPNEPRYQLNLNGSGVVIHPRPPVSYQIGKVLTERPVIKRGVIVKH